MPKSGLATPEIHAEKPQANLLAPAPPSPQSRWKRRSRKLRKRIGLPTTVVGIVTTFYAFFPHLTISQPVDMNSPELFSKTMTVTNDGLLPVFGVHCGMAIRKIIMGNGANRAVTVPNGINALTTPLTLANGERLIGAEDFSSRIQADDCYASVLKPGDGLTFSPEELILLLDSQAREGDFAIYISYRPLFPPVRMNQCVHFVLHESIVGGQKYWFRSPGQCALFPWMNH